MLSFHWTHGKIKVLLGSFHKKNYKIEKSFVIDIPEDELWSRGEGKVLDILRKELDKNDIKEKDVYFTLETKDFSLRIVEYPKLPLKELRENIIDELEEISSFREDSMDLSFTILSSDKERIKVLVATYPKDIINFWKDLFGKLNLNLKYMEISSISALRGLSLENHDFSKNHAILFLGSDVTDIYIFQRGNLVNLYNLSIGTSDLILYEDYKVESTLNSWIDEIRLYLSNLPFSINEFWTIGEEEKSVPIFNYLQDSFSDFSLNINRNLWLTNIGVSLGSLKLPPFLNLNLLGKEKISLSKETITRSLLAGLLAIIIILSANLYITIQRNSLKRERIFLEENLRQRRTEIEELRRTIEERMNFNTGLENWVKELSENKNLSPAYFLKDLSRITPVKVWLSNVEILEDNKILFEGYSLDNEGVADFLISLSYSNIFSDVNLQNSNLTFLGNKEVQIFRVVGVLK